MLRTSRINPNLSAHEQINGTHDFNATPLAPPGTRCITHEKASQHGTWAPHGQLGWYVGAAPEQYRCYQIYIPKIQGTRVCDTVEFFPTHCKMPNMSANDAAIYAANDLLKALTHPQPANSFISMGDDQIVALRQLATIFQCSIKKKPTSEPGVPDIAPPQRPRTRSQTKQLANAAITAPQRDQICHDPPPTPDDMKQQVDLDPEPPHDTELHTKHHIVQVIPNLRPKYPTKHEGMLEDPFPPTQSANAVMDPDTGKPLEYKQLINHPNHHLRQTWQQSSSNQFGRLAQGVGGRIAGTDTIRFIQYNNMPMNRRPTYARFVCEI